MMEENQEALFRLALHRHGLNFSESESDSDDGYAEFDYTHEQNKPPPLDPEFIRKNRIVIHPKEIENVWAKRMEAHSKKTENIKMDSVLYPISNDATMLVPDVDNSSGISEKEDANQKLDITEHGSPNTQAVKAEIKYVDPKSHLLHESFMETSIQDQSRLERINNSVSSESSEADIKKLSKKKKKKKNRKKKSARKENIKEISAERASQSIVEEVGNSVSMEVDAWVTLSENVDLHYAPPEIKASENYNHESNEITPTIYYKNEKIESDDENGNNNVPLDTDNSVDKNNKLTKINGIKEENDHEEIITTKPNLYGNLQEQTNCRKEISSASQINGKKKKKVKFVPLNLLDEKFSTTTQTIKDIHNRQNSPKNKKLKGVMKKKNLHHNMSRIDNNVNSYQKFALSPFVNCETNSEFYRNFPQLNTHLVDKDNKIIEETKQKNSYEEKTEYVPCNLQDEKFSTTTETIKDLHNQQNLPKNKKLKGVMKKKNLNQNNISKIDNNVNSYSSEEKTTLKLSPHESANLQDQTNNCKKELSSAKTEASHKKKEKTEFVASNLLDETSTIPSVSHSQQNRPGSNKEPSSLNTTLGTKKKTKTQLETSTITSEAEFSHTQQRMLNKKPPTTDVTVNKIDSTQRTVENREVTKHSLWNNQGLSTLLPYSGDIDKIFESPEFGQKNIHSTSTCVTAFSTFDEELKKHETIFLHYQQNISTNDRRGTSGNGNELSLLSPVRKKNKKMENVSCLKTDLTETDKKVFFSLKLDFPLNPDLESYFGFFKQNNSYCIDFSTFNGNVKEHEDKTYRKKEPYYEKNIIRAFAKFDTGKYTNLKTNFLSSFVKELEKTFSETQRQNEKMSHHQIGCMSRILKTDLNYFENIQYGLEMNSCSANTLKAHNFNELDSYLGMTLNFISNTGGQESSYEVEKRISVLVQPCHENYDYSLTENAKTDHILRKDFMKNESTKETRNQRDTFSERNEEEMLHFTLEYEKPNGASVRRRDNTILIKTDKTVTDSSDHYAISYINENYSENELKKPLSEPIKHEINQNIIRTVTETSKVPYPLTKIVHLLFVCVFLHLVISFMNWVIDNYLSLMLFFMCITILNN